MEAQQNIKWRRYWIYQGLPERFNIKTRLKKGEKEAWMLTRFKNITEPGDIVYYWSAGDSAGIYGWGEIVDPGSMDKSAPVQMKKGATKSNSDNRIEVECKATFDAPILKTHLSRDLSEFRALTILRNAQGTNFRVTTLEAEAINQLIISRTQPAPPGPEKIESESYPASVFNDYRYSGKVAQLINAGLKYISDNSAASRNLNAKLLMSLLVDLAKDTPSDPPDSTGYIRDKFTSYTRPYDVDLTWSNIKKSFDLDNNSSLPVSRELLEILTAARIAAVRTAKKERIRLRHLIAGILVAGLHDLQPPLPADALREAFFEFTVKLFPDDNEDAWQQLLVEEPKYDIPSVELQNILAKVTSDSPDGEDRLGIAREANAIAAILAAKNVEPPFAIGLFGDWGSGKTFFLKKIKEQIEKIARTSKEAAQTKPNAFCKTIVQIWFNAWHYVESNLWASLVDNILHELKHAVKEEEKGKEKYDTLMKELKLVQKGADLIREELETAKRNRNIARKRRKELIKQKISKKKRRAETLAQKVLDEVKDEGSQKAIVEAADNIEDLFGIENFKNSVQQVGTTARSLLDLMSRSGLLVNRTQLLWRSFIAGKTNTLYILVAILVFGVSLIVFFNTKIWNNIAASIAEVTALLGVCIAWAKKHFTKASTVVDTIEGIQHRINRNVKEAEDQRQERIIAFEHEIKQLDAEILAGERKLQDLEEKVKRIEADMNATAPERLVQFIIERAESEDYRKQLGLMAMIRDDFENLSDLMEQQKTTNNERTLNIPKIDRIILYIDDLDRCPPKRVVEVLRAIHLILAFPLFMVVVGVDSRWLSRSLKDRYPFLTLRDGEETNKNKPEPYSASTQDYLEKIFQVPYWLKSIDETQVKGLLQDIVEDEKEQDSVNYKTDNQENEGTPTQAVKSDDSSEDEQAGYTEQEYEGINQEDLNLNPRALTISENELTYMGHVGGFIGSTPRTVKRFVNIYRILKVSDIRSQRINFTEKSGGFRYPMLLLAILTGQPESGHLLFKCLHKAEDNYDLSSFLQSLPETIKNFEITDKANWEKFLALFTTFTSKHGTDMTVKELKEWLPQVTRYGYRELQI